MSTEQKVKDLGQVNIALPVQSLQYLVQTLFEPMELAAVIGALATSIKFIPNQKEMSEEQSNEMLTESTAILGKLLTGLPPHISSSLVEHLKSQGIELQFEIKKQTVSETPQDIH